MDTARGRLALTVLAFGWALGAQGQIDPYKRELIQDGYNQPLQGKNPLAGYAFYYLNLPGFLKTNLTLRLAVAPVYMDTQLGIAKVLGPHPHVGVGLHGDVLADIYEDLRQ